MNGASGGGGDVGSGWKLLKDRDCGFCTPRHSELLGKTSVAFRLLRPCVG